MISPRRSPSLVQGPTKVPMTLSVGQGSQNYFIIIPRYNLASSLPFLRQRTEDCSRDNLTHDSTVDWMGLPKILWEDRKAA